MKRPIKPLYLIEKLIFAAPPSPAAETPLNLVEVHHNHNPPIWQLAVIGVVAMSVQSQKKGNFPDSKIFVARTFHIKGVNCVNFQHL